MYGQTEATARISSFFLNEHPDKIDSVGTVIPGGKLTISRADENGCGEIVYEGKNVFLGYAHSLNQLFITEQESYKYTVLRYTGDAAWERRVLQRYPVLRGSVKYIQIEELPRTMNGKLDYKKLQEYI